MLAALLAVLSATAALAGPAIGTATAPATRPSTRPAAAAATGPATTPAEPAKPLAEVVRELKQAAYRDAAAMPRYAWQPAPDALKWVERAVRFHQIRRRITFIHYRMSAARIPVMEAAQIDASLPPGAVAPTTSDEEGWLLSVTYRSIEHRDAAVAGWRERVLPQDAEPMVRWADPTLIPNRDGVKGSGWPEGESIEPHLVSAY